VIDLRTDTVTRPTAAMRRAIAEAAVGDEQKGEDPTVIALEERVAELLGHEAAVFVPSATMANQIALRLLSQPGDELVAAATSHLLRSEVGGPAVHAGLMVNPVHTVDGRFDAARLRALASAGDRVQSATRVVSVENTHANGGGRVWPLALTREVVEAARGLGVRTHLDGARILNAAVAAGERARAWAQEFDTTTICFSKGLGCPFGAALATSRERIETARRFKQLFGGAMRQSGMMAAAALYALEHHVDRLADDHERARTLAVRLAEAGLPVSPNQVETNVVLLDAGALGLTREECIARMAEAGVLMSATANRGVVRAVTHLDLSRADVESAATTIVRVLAGIAVGVGGS
jgi:threonine aldolase